jgi:hypothetical protein
VTGISAAISEKVREPLHAQYREGALLSIIRLECETAGHLQPFRSRRERLFPSFRVGARRGQRVRGRLPHCAAADAGRAPLPGSVPILLAEADVGVWGLGLHVAGNLRGPSVHPFDNFIYGAPPLAPLLFPNLVVLALIALW